jgi:plasmid maintenance system killer protein
MRVMAMVMEMTIQTFGDRFTERAFRLGIGDSIPGEVLEKFLQRATRLDAATRLLYLAQPAGMRLRKVRGSEPDRYEVHVKRQWWVRFRWAHPDCFDVTLYQRRRYKR